MKDELIRHIIVALGSDVLDYAALQTSGPEIHQTSGSIFASDPVVDVGLDHELVTQVLPLVEVHGVVVCLASWGRGRWADVAIDVAYWPVRTRCDGVCTTSE